MLLEPHTPLLKLLHLGLQRTCILFGCNIAWKQLGARLVLLHPLQGIMRRHMPAVVTLLVLLLLQCELNTQVSQLL